MNIIYTNHLKWRLKAREISEDLPQKVFKNSERRYYDIQRKHYVAVGQEWYKNKLRLMMIAYDIQANTIEVITIHPIKEIQINHLLETGRWLKK